MLDGGFRVPVGGFHRQLFTVSPSINVLGLKSFLDFHISLLTFVIFYCSRSSCDSAVKYLYIQMELCDTRTLRVWIDEKNIQNVKKSLRDSRRRDKALDFAQQIVRGVEYIHSKALIHRDLKVRQRGLQTPHLYQQSWSLMCLCISSPPLAC